MPDYNIYIHSDVSSDNKPTKPNSTFGSKTKPKQSQEQNQKVAIVQKVGSFLSNPDSAIGEAKTQALGTLGKAGIVGAIILAATKVGVSTADKATSLYALNTGDTSGVNEWNYIKQVGQVMFTPFSTTINQYTFNLNLRRANERLLIRQQLLGDSVINNTYGRKV